MRLDWTWLVLIALLLGLCVGAASVSRSTWPSPVGDEATYVMQAESLAWDFDLLYSRQDYLRFVEHWGVQPEGLILQSGDGGARITFGKPFFYAAYLAPFSRLAPVRGPFVANALLLSLAALGSAHVLRRRIGRVAPLLVSAFVFGSVAFAYTFWVHADLFLMCLTALALGLAFDPAEKRVAARWLVVGLLLAVVGFSRPMYLSLFLPALAAIPAGSRRVAVPALAGGALAVFLAGGAVYQGLVGSWTSYGASRMGFYSYTGFPEVDFTAGEWSERLPELGEHAWGATPEILAQTGFPASLWTWNVVYYLFGRHVGILPYFLPAVLGFAGRPRGGSRWALVAAVVLSVVAFLWLRPFNFYGGGAALANRYFLPLYPALWWLPTRPIRTRWIMLAGAVAALFLYPLWLRPQAFPQTPEKTYRYVSPAARLLPYETTQSHLKPAGRDDVTHNGLWIKFLDRGVRPAGDATRLRLTGGHGTFLVGYHAPLADVDLRLYAPPELELEVRGGRFELLQRSGRQRTGRIVLSRPRARHPMWWTSEPFYLYRLTLRLEGAGDQPVAFELTP